MFTLPDTENGALRHIPMHPKIRSASAVKLPDQSTISRHWREARDALRMDWLHFHDLRHSAASEMINGEVDLYTVGAVLGHKSAQSTKRYAQLATAALRRALGNIGKKSPLKKKHGMRKLPANPRQYLVAPCESNTAPTDYESRSRATR